MKKIRDSQTIIGSLEGAELAGNRPKNAFKGTVTLDIKLVVEAGTVEITAGISSKRPKAPRGKSFFWVLDDGSLSTEHPQQTDMFSGPRAAAER
jgi:hypothetical protein